MSIQPLNTDFYINNARHLPTQPLNIDFYINDARHLPTQPRTAAPQRDVLVQTPPPANVNRELHVHAAPSHSDLGCFGNTVRFFFESFESFKNWITDLFFPESPSDPALLARWDAVVQKDYDPVGAANPGYSEAYNAGWRGRTMADALVRAASKTGVNPPFNQILVRNMYYQATGMLFYADSHGDGGYQRLEQRAREGAFNNPQTLILFTTQQNFTESEKQEWIASRIRLLGENYAINNATFLVLNANESNELSLRNRMPASLLAFFQSRAQLSD